MIDDYDPMADWLATGHVYCGDCGARVRTRTLETLPPHGCVEREQRQRQMERIRILDAGCRPNERNLPRREE